MLPIVGILEEEVDKNCFLSALAEKLGVQVDEILDYELNLYNADRAGEEDRIARRIPVGAETG